MYMYMYIYIYIYIYMYICLMYADFIEEIPTITGGYRVPGFLFVCISRSGLDVVLEAMLNNQLLPRCVKVWWNGPCLAHLWLKKSNGFRVWREGIPFAVCQSLWLRKNECCSKVQLCFSWIFATIFLCDNNSELRWRPEFAVHPWKKVFFQHPWSSLLHNWVKQLVMEALWPVKVQFFPQHGKKRGTHTNRGLFLLSVVMNPILLIARWCEKCLLVLGLKIKCSRASSSFKNDLLAQIIEWSWISIM